MNRYGLLLALEDAADADLGLLNLPGWQILHASTPEMAEQLLLQRDCVVGLVVLSPSLLHQQNALEHLLGLGHLEWIALVPGHALQDVALCHFILHHFRDYHTLPLDTTRLGITMGHAMGMSRLKARKPTQSPDTGRFGMIGHSPPMQQLYRQIEKVVRADDPVLISGPSGTGKELAASAIHRHSARAKGPFVAVDCGAIPSNLIQSELFGYEKGAFTGASQRKLGKVEAANGGVLFLDELGNLPIDMQTNLLRFLQEGCIVRLGGHQPISTDVRIIAATHVNLAQAVTAGRFREDLYYRLNVLCLELRPLRERREDIPLLAEGIFTRLAANHPNLRVSGFSNEAMNMMLSYAWPGNVRELINRIRRGMIMSENRLLSAADLGLSREFVQEPIPTLGDARVSFENRMVEACLRTNGNNISQAARQLGVSRMTLYRLINKFNITLERPTRNTCEQRNC